MPLRTKERCNQDHNKRIAADNAACAAYSRYSMENLGASQELSTPVGFDRWGEGRVSPSAFTKERCNQDLNKYIAADDAECKRSELARLHGEPGRLTGAVHASGAE